MRLNALGINNGYHLICITGIFLLFHLSLPNVNFPLNDDWAFAHSVKIWLSLREIRMIGWSSMTLLGQVFWGGLFCWEGFSFLNLRYCTLFTSLVGCLIVHQIIINQNKTNFLIPLIGVFTLLFNPWMFVLSNTFMTDVHFLVFTIIGVYFLDLHERSNKSLFYQIIGLGFLFYSVTIRQFGLLTVVLYLFVQFVMNRKKGNAILFVAGTLITVASYFLLTYILKEVIHLKMFGEKESSLIAVITENPLAAFSTFLNNIILSLYYLGLFMLPITFLNIKHVWKNSDLLIIAITCFLVSFTYLSIYDVMFHKRFPYFENIIYNFGVGPYALKDAAEFYWEPRHKISIWTLRILVLIGCIGIGLLLSSIFDILRSWFQRPKNKLIDAFLFSIWIIYTCLICLIHIYDRYLLFSLAMLIILVARNIKSELFGRIPSFLFLIALALFSYISTTYYLNWNLARWEFLSDLINKGVSYKEIDGGFEFNGWYGFDPNHDIHKINPKSWYWVIDDKYAIVSHKLEDYDILKQKIVANYLSSSTDTIMLIKRKDPKVDSGIQN